MRIGRIMFNVCPLILFQKPFCNPTHDIFYYTFVLLNLFFPYLHLLLKNKIHTLSLSGFYVFPHKFRLYHRSLNERPPFRNACSYSNHRIVVEPYPIRVLVADCPLLKYLGLRHISFSQFFLISPHSRLTIFHVYVVVCETLGGSSN